MSPLRALPARGPAPGDRRLLNGLLVAGALCLTALAVGIVWRERTGVLRAVERGVVTVGLRDAGALARQQGALAARLAVVVEAAERNAPAQPAALRFERQTGPDATEIVATDATSRLAIGGVLVLDAPGPIPRRDAVLARVVATLPVQRLALEGVGELEAAYLVLPGARLASRVPYIGAEQLRLRQREARLGQWFDHTLLDTDRPSPAPTDMPDVRLARDPASGTRVVRVDQDAWIGAASGAARVVVTFPVRSYLRRLASADPVVPVTAAILGEDGEAAGTVVDAPGEEIPTFVAFPASLRLSEVREPSFTRHGGWFALRATIPGSRIAVVAAAPTSEVYLEALRRSKFELGLVLLCMIALAVIGWTIGHRVLAPASRTVAQLTAAERLAREIADGVPGFAVFKVTQRDGATVSTEFVSRGTGAVLGVPAVAIDADWQHAFDSIVPEDADAVRAACARALADATPWRQEFRVRRHDEERWLQVEARAARAEDRVELVGAWRDITEVREHTDALAAAHRRLAEFADGVPGAVIQWRVASDGRVEVAFVGNRLAEVAGVGAADVYTGLHALEQVQLAEDLDAVRRARQQAVATRAGYAVEFRVMHPARGLRWLREEGVSHPAADCAAAFTVHLSDVTQQRKEAAELRRAKEEAEMATRAKSVFLATMSHEIRTPMTGISGMLEVLTRSVLDADQRQQLATIADSARTLRRILDDVLDFSRIEAGKMTIERRPLSVDDVVEASAGLYAASAAEKGIRLRATVDPRLGELVMGDAVRLRQVLGNLLSNAVKFTSRGTVRLAVAQEETTETHRLLRFEVTDTGVGIPYDTQARLFAPFERGEHHATTQVGGTGLGLALVRRIVELMDGNVELRSLPGVGTSVQARIPFERLHEETTDHRVWLGDLRVAILHDTEVDARFLAELLEARGASVLVVAPEGVATVPADTPADVLVSGPDVAREVQHALRSRLAPGATGRTQIVRLFERAGLRPELRGDGGVTIAPHARRSALLRAVAIAAGKDQPDLPASPSEPNTPVTAVVASVEEAIADRRLILVCEDHPIAQRVIEKQLRVLGYAAELHPNGHSGLAAWRTGRYGLVLTDLHMPEMDGLTLARRIRAEEARLADRGRTPIIALSGNAFDEQRIVCVEAGMDDFLAKPALLQELDATLRFWLPPASQPATPAQAEPPPEQAVTLPAPLSHKALKESLGDDPIVLRQALSEFSAADTEDMAVLAAAADDGNDVQVVSSAHRIEGAARMLGAVPYARAAERVKRLFGVTSSSPERTEALRLLQQEGERLRTWLHTTRDWFERVHGAGAAV